MVLHYAGGEVSPEELVRHLAISGMLQDAAGELLVRKEAERKAGDMDMEATDDELQEFADSFRKVNRLFSASETNRFLRAAGANLDDFE